MLPFLLLWNKLERPRGKERPWTKQLYSRLCGGSSEDTCATWWLCNHFDSVSRAYSRKYGNYGHPEIGDGFLLSLVFVHRSIRSMLAQSLHRCSPSLSDQIYIWNMQDLCIQRIVLLPSLPESFAFKDHRRGGGFPSPQMMIFSLSPLRWRCWVFFPAAPKTRSFLPILKAWLIGRHIDVNVPLTGHHRLRFRWLPLV